MGIDSKTEEDDFKIAKANETKAIRKWIREIEYEFYPRELQQRLPIDSEILYKHKGKNNIREI